MSEFKKEDARSILKSRTVVGTSGKYQVKVTSVNPFEDKQIVNVAAMNIYQANEARTLFAEEDYQGAVNKNLSFNVRNSSANMPVKGEEIYITVKNVKLKSGETALLISSWSAMPVSQGQSFSFDDAEVKAEELANSESEFDAQ